MVPGSQPAPPRLMPRCLAVTQSNTVAEGPWGVLIRGWGEGPALGTHRHSGTDPLNSQRARRVALACEIVGEDYITRSKTARGAIADPDFHLPHENKNVLSPGRGVPIAPLVRRETAEHEVGTRLKATLWLSSAGRGRSSKWVWPSWPVYIRTIMRVLLPIERSSCTQRRTPRQMLVP